MYDSLHALSIKPKEERISYPMNVDHAARQISRHKKLFTMVVENVQQQNRGEDSGLFAITYAALLCANQDPAKTVINQNIMRQELLHILVDMDITRFVKNVTKIDETKAPMILHQWTRKIHCICHLPDDGSKMVQCSKFTTWYHQHCVRGDFFKLEWLCPKCELTETGDNPHEEHATIKEALADYDDGQGSTSKSATLNILISDAKQVNDHHDSAQGRKIGMSHTKHRSPRVKQSPVCQQEL